MLHTFCHEGNVGHNPQYREQQRIGLMDRDSFPVA